MKTPETGKDTNVLRKTPEEIKKGLELCSSYADCEGCPYIEGEVFTCYDRMKTDAIALIQQLESRLAQVERERDAAVADLETVIELSDIVNLDCEYCKYMDRPVCEECEWEWRGVCEENTKEDEENAD